jgi:hypothetical protein
VTVHPKHGKPYNELEPQQRAFDVEYRKLAASFLLDISHATTYDEARVNAMFGKFTEEDKAAVRLQYAKVTDHVRSRFEVLQSVGFREAWQAATASPRSDDSRRRLSPRFLRTSGSLSQEDELEEREPPAVRRRILNPADEARPATVTSAQHTALAALSEADLVHMFCASFEDWGGSEEARSIHGKVALILTDPAYC